MNDIDIHTPPQNLEAERSVLGAIMLDGDVMSDVADVLTSEDFLRDIHQIIYRVISDLYSQGKAIDAVTIADELTLRDQFKLIGGHEMLLEIANSVPSAANVKYHAEIVRRKSMSRRLIQRATEIIRDGYSDLFTDDQLLDSALQKLFREVYPYSGLRYELIDLFTCDYRLYLMTDHWNHVRTGALERFGHRCAVCNSKDSLDIHHRTYVRRGRELREDVIPLCRKCHRLFHDNGHLAIDEGNPFP